jgi:hypothetical protein
MEGSLSSRNWSREEVEATVTDYFSMLILELAGLPYNKAAHNRGLQNFLSNRTRVAIERKHHNISAILGQLGCDYIDGYKPLGNYQQLLREVVFERVYANPSFARAALQGLERNAVAPEKIMLNILVEPPRITSVREPKVVPPYQDRVIRCDYLAIEARNRSLGVAGEQFIAEFEARRLHAAGHRQLADRIDHVSRTKGDGFGYDVLSFEPSGEERFIEVKTTAFAARTPFFMSPNEIRFSAENASQFVLARVHEFRSKPKFFELKGSIRELLKLEPVSYRAHL